MLAGTLAAVNEAFEVMKEKITHFGTSPSAIEARITTEEKLGLIPRSSDPNVAALQHDRDVQLEELHLSDAEEAKIRALNLNTAEGRAKLLAWEQDLFRRAAAGQLTPAELGAFGSVDELAQSISDAADDLHAFDAAVSAATKSLSNVPDTFKLAAAEWEARARDTSGQAAQPASFPRIGFTPPPRGGDGASLPLPTDGRGRERGVKITGPLTLNVMVPGANRSLGDIARAVKAELEDAALGNFGLGEAP